MATARLMPAISNVIAAMSTTTRCTSRYELGAGLRDLAERLGRCR